MQCEHYSGVIVHSVDLFSLCAHYVSSYVMCKEFIVLGLMCYSVLVIWSGVSPVLVEWLCWNSPERLGEALCKLRFILEY